MCDTTEDDKMERIIFGHLYCMAIRLFYVGKFKRYNSFIRSSHLINKFLKTFHTGKSYSITLLYPHSLASLSDIFQHQELSITLAI